MAKKTGKQERSELQSIPGIGPKLSEDLEILGFHSVAELKDQDPEEMYLRLCHHIGQPIDRCVLYVFRCAVYYASREQPQAELLKWWNWKDRTSSDE